MMKKINIPEDIKTIACDGNLCSFFACECEIKQVRLNPSFCSTHPKVYFQCKKQDIRCNYCGAHFVNIGNWNDES